MRSTKKANIPGSRGILHHAFRAAILLVLVAACGESVTPEQHIANARAAMASDDYNTATIELKNALQQEGSNAEARLLLGEVHLANGNIAAAEKELRRARELGSKSPELVPTLARVLATLGQREELEALSTDELDAAATATVIAARALLQARDNDGAENALMAVNSALELDPQNLYALGVKARIYGVRREFTLMREQVEAILEMDEASSDAWLMLGDVESAQGHPEAAEAAYTRAAELLPNPTEALLRRAIVRIERGEYESAEEDVDKLLAVAPLSPAVNYAKGLILFQRQELQDALAAFAIAERDRQRHPMAFLYSGIAHYSLGNMDQAAGYANQFYNIAPGNVAGRKLLASVLLGQGKFERAEELMRPVVAANAQDVAAMNLLANALMSQGESGEAIDILNAVASLDPESSAAQIRLGASLIISGDSKAGVEKLETALELNPEFQQADILLVLNYVRQGDFDQAISAAQAYRARNPTEVTPLNLLGRIYRQAGQDADAVASFEKALSLSPGDPAAHLNLAEMALAEDDVEAARSHYDAVRKYDATNLAALLKLAELDAREQKMDSMLGRLEQAVEEHPESIRARVLLARAYLALGRPEQVAVVFSELDEAGKSVPAVLNETVRAQLALGEYASARLSLDRLESSGVDTALLHHQKAIAAAGLEDVAELQEELEKSLEAQPDYLPARLALARLFLRNRDVENAARQIDVLAEMAGDFPDVLLMQAALADQKGDSGASLQYATRAYEILPNTNTMLNLSLRYRQQGKEADALKLQESWVAEHPDDQVAKRALAETYMAAGQTDKMMEQYQKILDLDDDNLVALNNLAWYLLETDTDRALSYARRAEGVDPNSPDVLDTLALAYYHKGNLTLAKRNLERALALRPGDPSLQYHQAMLMEAGGDRAGARAILEPLLAGGKPFPERDKAEQLLIRLY